VTPTPILSDSATACPDAPAITIKRDAWAQVSLYPPVSNNVRREPRLKAELLGSLTPGEPVWIVGGPRCADGYAWWFVHSLSGLEGWTAEGDAENYWLVQLADGFYYDTGDKSAASKTVLAKGQKYRIILSGTYSQWIAEQWTNAGVCIRGEAEPLPMFPSAGKTNGPVGADPFYRFARPFYGPCEELVDARETIGQIMFSLDGGQNYSLAVPRVAAYREDHTYVYEVIGQGYPLKVRLDDAPLDDNYGRILIAIGAEIAGL
jgi:hypothetical protein